MAELAGLHAAFGDGGLQLEPLADAHRDGLRAACAEDEAFWPLYPESFGTGRFDASFDARLASPVYTLFALFADARCIGMSGYLNVDAANDRLEIGGTYLMPAARGTGLNRRIKTLLIDRAIARGFRRIEFRIDVRNARSRAAVAKLGAVHEGTLRKDRRIWTGHIRDTMVWSILADEWTA